MVNRTVAFVDASRCESGLLELAVDVAGEDECAVLKRSADLAQDAESVMRCGMVKNGNMKIQRLQRPSLAIDLARGLSGQ